jgi:uncharacterized repeat protein (TIGR01451 family)
MQSLLDNVTRQQLRPFYRRGNAILVLALSVIFTPANLALAQDFRASLPVSPYSVNIDLRKLPPVTPGSNLQGVPLLTGGPTPVFPPALPASKSSDPLWEASISLAPSELSTTPPEFSNPFPNFEGISRDQTGFRPPDPNGAVGPNHYIQAVNASFQIFNKDGTDPPGGLGGPFRINSLWAVPGVPATDPCRAQNIGDPYVLYDHLADRWLISQFARDPTVTGNPLRFECIAISPTSDPTAPGVWHLYTFNLGFSNDYPKIGVWPDGYYMVSQEGYNGNPVDVTVFDRANMLNGNPATFQTASVAGPPTIIMLPSDLTGSPPPPGTPNFFVRPIDGALFGGADRIEIFEFHVDWGVPANSTFGVGAAHAPNQTLTPAAFSSDICAGANLFNNCVPQPNPATALLLEVLSVWPMGPLQFRNFGSYQTLVFNHSVDVNGAGLTGIRWYELRRSGGSWSIQQQGTFSPPDGLDIHRWMGSLAMDKAGNMALGYSVSNGSTVPATQVFPGIRYAGRLASDPLGLLPQGEVTLMAGSGRMLPPDDGFEARWGDYSAMRVDPVDGCTFWYTTEYLPASTGSARWRTRIGAFRFPSCNPVDLAIFKTANQVVVEPGEDLFYTLTVSNRGPDNATDVVVTDTLPERVTFVVATEACVESPPKTLTCRLGDLAAGKTVTFIIKVVVDAHIKDTITITNRATVTAAQQGPDNNNNTAKVTTIVEKERRHR